MLGFLKPQEVGMGKRIGLVLVMGIALMAAPMTASAASPWADEITYKDKVCAKLKYGVKNALLGWTSLVRTPMQSSEAGENVLVGVVQGVGPTRSGFGSSCGLGPGREQLNTAAPRLRWDGGGGFSRQHPGGTPAVLNHLTRLGFSSDRLTGCQVMDLRAFAELLGFPPGPESSPHRVPQRAASA